MRPGRARHSPQTHLGGGLIGLKQTPTSCKGPADGAEEEEDEDEEGEEGDYEKEEAKRTAHGAPEEARKEAKKEAKKAAHGALLTAKHGAVDLALAAGLINRKVAKQLKEMELKEGNFETMAPTEKPPRPFLPSLRRVARRLRGNKRAQ